MYLQIVQCRFYYYYYKSNPRLITTLPSPNISILVLIDGCLSLAMRRFVLRKVVLESLLDIKAHVSSISKVQYHILLAYYSLFFPPIICSITRLRLRVAFQDILLVCQSDVVIVKLKPLQFFEKADKDYYGTTNSIKDATYILYLPTMLGKHCIMPRVHLPLMIHHCE